MTAGLIRVAPDVLASDWLEFVEERLTDPAEVEVGLVDVSGLILYHPNPERAGGNLEGDEEDGVEIAPVGSDLRSYFGGGEAIASIEAVGGRWYVALQRPWSNWREALSGPGVPVVILLGAAALVTTALLALSASRLTRPLRELASASRAIAEGNFTARPPRIRTGDELEVLAEQFDIMRLDLESLYTGLEQRVASRTAELAAVVDLAGEVSRTFEAREIARIAEHGLRQHPGVEEAVLWLPERTAELAGYRAAVPDWADARVMRRAARGEERAAGNEAGGPRLEMLELPLGDENAVLTVACRADADPEIGAFLEAVAAHITIALSNAILYRQGRSAAALEERTRLARDIHDTLAQSFTGVIVQLEALSREREQDGAPEERIGRTLELARAGLAEARRSVSGLRSSALDGRPMGEALGARVEQMERTSGITTRLTVEGDDTNIPVEVVAELFRIAEEALTNVQRHAQAGHALVNLTVRESEVRLVVEDDGIGMTAGAGAGDGYGLTGMSERAERVGGRLRIESDPGEGTRVEAIIAIEPDGRQR